MPTSTMNISLPETLKRFVRQRTKAANYSNPSDYVRSLIREDQRRLEAERLFEALVVKNAPVSVEGLMQLKADFWVRWGELKSEIDKGVASLDAGLGREIDRDYAETIIQRGRARRKLA